MDLSKVEDMLRGVTEGPWYSDGPDVRMIAQNIHWHIVDAKHHRVAAFIAFARAWVPEAAAALTALSAERDALAAQVAELTRERDDFKSEWDKALELAERSASLMSEMDDRRLAAEAKVARLEGERNMAVSALEFEAKRSRRHLAASTLAILAALTEGDTNG